MTVYDAARRYRTDRDARAACLAALVEDLAAAGEDLRLVIELDDSLLGFDSDKREARAPPPSGRGLGLTS